MHSCALVECIDLIGFLQHCSAQQEKQAGVKKITKIEKFNSIQL